MIKFSFANLISILFDVLSDSFVTIIFIFFGLIFLIAMIIQIKKYKKIGKSLFIVGWFFVIIFVLFKFFDSLNIMLDNFINNIFMQIFFPNLATYFLLIVFTNIIFMFTVFNNKSKSSDKIINYFFFVVISFLLIVLLEQVAISKVNIYQPLDAYKNKNILTLVESSTIIFLVWIMIITSKKIIRFLINSNEKMTVKDEKNEDELNQNNDENSIVSVNSDMSAENSVDVEDNTAIDNNYGSSLETLSSTDLNPVDNTIIINNGVNNIEDNAINDGVIINSVPTTENNSNNDTLNNIVTPINLPATQNSSSNNNLDNVVIPINLPATENSSSNNNLDNVVIPINLPTTENGSSNDNLDNVVIPINLPTTENGSSNDNLDNVVIPINNGIVTHNDITTGEIKDTSLDLNN